MKSAVLGVSQHRALFFIGKFNQIRIPPKNRLGWRGNYGHFQTAVAISSSVQAVPIRPPQQHVFSLIQMWKLRLQFIIQFVCPILKIDDEGGQFVKINAFDVAIKRSPDFVGIGNEGHFDA